MRLAVQACQKILQRRALHYLYLPLYAASFSEINLYTEKDLLKPAIELNLMPKHKFAAYMYSNCEVEYREAFFDMLRDAAAPHNLEVHALGRCKGKSTSPEPYEFYDRTINADSSGDGTKMTYLDIAIHRYASYRWVVVFENGAQRDINGVVSEKIASAMLANAIPIYYGPRDALRSFNPRSIIHCGDYASWQECAHDIVRIDRSDGYFKMLKESWVLPNSTANKHLDRKNFAQRLGDAIASFGSSVREHEL